MKRSNLEESINKLFIDCDESTKEEILIKVTGHLIEFVKQRVYKENYEEINKALEVAKKDFSAQEYANLICSKLDSLPKRKEKKF